MFLIFMFFYVEVSLLSFVYADTLLFDRSITVISYCCNILEYYLLVRLFCNFDTCYTLIMVSVQKVTNT